MRSLYEEKIGSRKPAGNAGPLSPLPPGEERRDRERPWPDNPEIPDLRVAEFDAGFLEDEFPDWMSGGFERPTDEDTREEDIHMLRRQRLFRWAAQAIAVAVSELPEVEKVSVFGATSQPLKAEVPRFREFRRHRIEVLHECADLDLAIWLNDLSRLRQLKNAMARGLALTQDTPCGGVAHHQVDVYVFDAAGGEYRGRLCSFGKCPKPGKAECLVPDCGAQPLLRQFADFDFKPAKFTAAPKVVLFDRSAGFLVPLPKIEGPPDEFEPQELGISGEDVPF